MHLYAYLCYNVLMRKTLVSKNCIVCGEPFEVKLSHSARIQCCSNACGCKFKQNNFDKALELKLNVPIADWLHEYYLAKSWPFRRICAYLGINMRTLMRYMRKFNIHTRHGSAAVKTQWIDNPRRRQQTSDLFKSLPHPSGDQNVSKRPDVRAKISQAKMGAGNAMYNVLGINNPKWKGGKMTLRGKGWNSIRTQVLRRDNNTCQQCGSTEKLQVHHIVTWRTKKNFNKLTNLVTLCHKCHIKQPIHKL